MLRWPLCGTKLSLCCSIISVWGIVQFILLGIFFFTKAVPLSDDFEFDHHTHDEKIFEDRLHEAYDQRAYNCWIAAFLYVGLLVFAGSQFMINQKNESTSSSATSMMSPFSGITTEHDGVDQRLGMQLNDDRRNS
jgi:ribonuclease kappa